jgi:hypothetical protein
MTLHTLIGQIADHFADRVRFRCGRPIQQLHHTLTASLLVGALGWRPVVSGTAATLIGRRSIFFGRGLAAVASRFGLAKAGRCGCSTHVEEVDHSKDRQYVSWTAAEPVEPQDGAQFGCRAVYLQEHSRAGGVDVRQLRAVDDKRPARGDRIYEGPADCLAVRDVDLRRQPQGKRRACAR